MEQTSLAGNTQTTSYHIGEVEFTPQHKQLVFNHHRVVKLTQRESLILQYLLERPNQAITLSEILNNCLKTVNPEPIATRRTIQLISAKLETADFIEYPYIDCYRFAQTTSQKHPAHKLLGYFKRFFNGELNTDKDINKSLLT